MNPLKILLQLINASLFLRFTIKGRFLPGFISKKEDLVIDLGGGDKPFWRADVVLDKSSFGDEHRYSSSGIIKNIGLYVESDIIKTPFKNRTFDFSFCSHVLEHVQRPDQAIKEIIRISKKGYIEVPNGIMELIYPYQGHLWFIFQVNNELIFIRKGMNMHKTLSSASSKYFYLAKLVSTPFISFYWKDSIKYKIIDELKDSDKFYPYNFDKNIQPSYIHNAYILLVKLFRILFYISKEEKISLLKDQLVKKIKV